MEYITDPASHTFPRGTVVTLGKFDGVHKGHRKLLQRVLDISREGQLDAAVFTFDVPPQVRIGHKPARMLMTNAERRQILSDCGISLLVEYPFTEQVRNMTAEEFCRKVLREQMHAEVIIAGSDFHFGRNRQGNADYLQAHQRNFGFRVEILDKEMDGDREISSTYIREELTLGHMEKVKELMQLPYSISGPVVHGENLGHKLGFATLNQIPEESKLLPPNGVYFSLTRIHGQEIPSITNIGNKPTVQGKQLGVETHLLGFCGDLYGKDVCVSLLHYQRPEQRFLSVEALSQQIRDDICRAESFHGMA